MTEDLKRIRKNSLKSSLLLKRKLKTEDDIFVDIQTLYKRKTNEWPDISFKNGLCLNHFSFQQTYSESTKYQEKSRPSYRRMEISTSLPTTYQELWCYIIPDRTRWKTLFVIRVADPTTKGLGHIILRDSTSVSRFGNTLREGN